MEESEKLSDFSNGLKINDQVTAIYGINSYVFRQHETPEEEAMEKLNGMAKDWMVLLRVGSDDKCGFQFWDSGVIFFVIHKSDLKKGNFSNVYCGIESS